MSDDCVIAAGCATVINEELSAERENELEGGKKGRRAVAFTHSPFKSPNTVVAVAAAVLV